jgi:TP901 family phage tail tape measure protein
MVGEQIAAAYAKVGLDFKEMDSSMAGQKGKFSSFCGDLEGRAGKMGAAIGNALKTGFLVAGAAVAGAAVAGTKAFADYEQGLASVSKTTGLTGKELEALGNQLRQLATAGPVTVGEFEKIASAAGSLGIGAKKMAEGDLPGAREEIVAFSKTVSDMAIAFEMDVETVSTSMADIANVFNIPTEGLGKLGSQFNALENSMSATAPQIIEFVNRFGGTATMFGESAAATAAFGATLSELGVKGDEASTQLRSGILQLTQATNVSEAKIKAFAKSAGISIEDAQKQMANGQENIAAMARLMGISATDLASMLDKDLYGTLIKMGGAFKNIESDTTKAAEAQKIFGAYGYQALIKLGDGADEYATALGLINVQGDEITKEAATMANTIWGQWDRMKNGINDVGISIGEVTSGPFRDFLAFMNDSIIPSVKEFIIAFTAGDWGKVGDMMAKGIKAGWDKLKDLGKSLYDKIRSVNWSGLGSYVTRGIISAWNELKSLGGQLLGWLRGIDWGSIGAMVAGSLMGIGQWIYSSITSIDWVGISSYITTGLAGMLETLSGYGQTIYDAISKVDWSKVGETILSSIGNLADQISSLFAGIKWGDIGEGIKAAIDSAIASLSNIGSKVLDYFDKVRWEEIGSKIADGIKTVTQNLGNVAASVADIFKKHPWDSVGQDIGTKIKDAIGKVTGWAQKVIDGFKANMSDFGQIGTDAGNKIKDALGAIKDYATGIYTNIKKGLQDWVAGNDLKNLGVLVVDAIAAGIAGTVWATSELAKAFISLFSWENFKEAADWVTLGLRAIGEFTTGFVSEGVNIGGQLAANVLQGFADAIKASGVPYAAEMAAQISGASQAIRTGTSEYSKFVYETGGTGIYSNIGTGAGGITPTPAAVTSPLPTGAAIGSKFWANGVEYEMFSNGQWMPTGVTEVTPAAAPAAMPSAAAGPTAPVFELSREGTELYHLVPGRGVQQVQSIEDVVNDALAAGVPLEKIAAELGEIGVELPANLIAAFKESQKISVEGARGSVDILKDGIMYGMEDFKTGIGAGTNQVTTSFNQGAGQLRGASAYAQTALKLGAEVGSSFLTDAGQTVAIGLDQSTGKLTAYIGSSAEKLLGSSQQGGQSLQVGGQLGGDAAKIGLTAGASQASLTSINAASQGATRTTTAAATFQSRIDAGAATAMAAIARAGDPAQKLVVGAQYAASALIQAGQSVASAVASAISRASYYSPYGGGSWQNWQEGTVTTCPQMAMIGEDGAAYPEYVIPTKKKRWDLLLSAMRAYGIPGYAEGTSTGGAGADATDAEEMRAYFGIKGLASMSKQVQKIINDLKDFFRISWSIIKSEGAVYWKGIETVITNEATLIRDAAWQSALDIRNTWLSSNLQIKTDTAAQWAAIWPAIEPSQKDIHDNIISSWSDARSQVSGILNMMAVDGIMQLTTFQSDWNAIWSQLLSDLQNTAAQITALLQSMGATLSSIQVNATTNISGGGGYGGGGDYGGGGSAGPGGSGDVIMSGGQANFQDTTCLGDMVLVNALQYTNPAGNTYYINPMTYQETGGISRYQGAKGALIDDGPKRITVGEAGPELILPAKLTRMFLSLADAGLGKWSEPGGNRVIIEDHTKHELHIDGKKIADITMKRATQKLKLRGAIPTK